MKVEVNGRYTFECPFPVEVGEKVVCPDAGRGTWVGKVTSFGTSYKGAVRELLGWVDDDGKEQLLAERRSKKGEMPPSKRGHNMYEVISAFQKAIRRSDIEGAIYWGAEAFGSGYQSWIWKRLRLIVSEDIGPAAPGLPADVQALYQTATDWDIKTSWHPFVHAVILAANAPKSRIVDWALLSDVVKGTEKDREVPDEALDMHTYRGKAKGRGAGHFVKEAGKLIQPGSTAQRTWRLAKLEEKYEAEFAGDQSRWRDPDPELVEAEGHGPTDSEDEEEKKGRMKPGQRRLLP